MPFSSSTCCGAHLTIWVHHCHPQQLYKALSIVHYPFPLCRLHSPCPLCLPDMGSYTQLHLTNTLSFIEHIRLIFSIWLLSTVCIRPCDCWSSDCSGFWNSLKLRKSPCQSKIQMDVAGRASPRQSFFQSFLLAGCIPLSGVERKWSSGGPCGWNSASSSTLKTWSYYLLSYTKCLLSTVGSN